VPSGSSKTSSSTFEMRPRRSLVSGPGVTPGHWAHREPAPHGEPVVLGGHPDDRFVVTAHLPSGASVTLSAHRNPDDARRAMRELIG
jgi:hypothetical protein